ncbi:putative quinol-cytochrome c reductase, cytochrome b subunit [Nitrospira sp. KM1]|uniref:cytochrome b n=1 Tax=Nitrospira sp. KM1 TaxID=1936990 RepID=UPI0013A77A62|nr:cytochrome b N-terminal domain-containing protein [Nitrospira sp. KM1]BCA56799.1 putative quinol-cytochrome c reductase, cytochrome b subunit [Nitrospira sp. KM1]
MATQTAHAEQDVKPKSLIDYIQKDLPEHLDWWPYTLGAIPMTLFGILVGTGLLLTFYYVPSTERAYESVDQITHEIYLGWFVRGLHKTSVDLMILFLLFHVIRVFLTRAYQAPGELKWVSGSIVLFVTFAMGFTGYSLVFDNVSYWGMTVVTNMIGTLPVIGMPLLHLLRGGEDVSGVTLLRLYDLHTKLLPVLLGGLVIGHVVIVRLMGFVEVKESRHFHQFYPEHTLKMGMIAVGLLVVIVDLVMIFPPVLGPPANPQEVASDVSPPWYFSAPFMWITLLPGPLALWTLIGASGLFVVYPFLDRALVERGVPMELVNRVVATVAVAAMVALMYLDTQM